MADWTEELNQFLNEKGMQQSLPEFNASDEFEIQETLNGTAKPSFEKIKLQLDLYPNVKAEISTSKKNTDSVMEQVQFRIYKAMRNKFTYRLKFSKLDNDIYAKGQFCIPNIYGDNTKFTDTSLSELISDLTEENIAEDFTKSFKENFDNK